MKPAIIAPSLLAADYSRMADGVELIERASADWIHVDVMDGSFVPPITFGHKMVSDLKPLTKLPLDVHLMVQHPGSFIDDFARAGADHITIHVEAAVHLDRLLKYIREAGCKPGISIVPSTPVCMIEEILPLVDIILVMTVNPGYGGQNIIPACLDKVSVLRSKKDEKGYSYLLEVDGGINRDTYKEALTKGSEVLVVGSAFFVDNDPNELVQRFKKA